MEISKGRQILTPEDLDMWQKDTEAYLLSNPVLAECFQDPSRLFNQDETSIELGSSDRRVLAKKGTKVICHVSSGSREHITVSFSCNAAGGMVPPRVIYKGVRNMAVTHLQNLPENGLSGKWNFSVSPKGYIVCSLFLDVLKDINNYVQQKQIKKPVILIMDGASPHLSLDAAAFCKANQIQPWLLRPNMTHLTQPLDLVFFADLKKTLKNFAWKWQTDPKNTGQVLTKYSVIGLLQEVTEKCLAKPCLLQNGFKRAGLFPWNKAAPDRSKLLPGSVFASNHDSQGAITLPVTSFENSNLDSTFGIQPLADRSHIEQPVLNTDVDPSESPLNLNILTDSQPQVLESSVSTELAGQPDSFLMSSMDLSLTDNPVIDDTISESIFQPISSSTFNVESELQSTFKCSSCNRVIMEKFRAMHLVNCSPPDVQFESVAGPSMDSPIPVSRKENTPPPRRGYYSAILLC